MREGASRRDGWIDMRTFLRFLSFCIAEGAVHEGWGSDSVICRAIRLGSRELVEHSNEICL